MAEGKGTGVPEPHQEIEDEPSILDTNFDLTSQAAGGEEGQIATPSTRQSLVGIANTSLIQTSSSEETTSGGSSSSEEYLTAESESDTETAAGGEEGQLATPSAHQSLVGIEKTSLFQTSSSEGGGEIAIPNTECQVGIANPDTHQAKPYDVVVAGGDFKNANFGPHTSTSNFKATNYVNQTFNYNFHSATNQEPSTSAVKRGDATQAQSEKLQEGYIRISDDTVMYKVAPIREGTNVYEGYQEHVSEDGSLKKLPVAIKKIILSTPKHRAEVQHLLTLTSHPNIVRIIRSKEYETQHSNVLYIVMELCSLQNLNDYLKENRENDVPFDFNKTLKFTKQLVKGMKHIHDNGIVHRDVKPGNILLSTDKTQLKFTDFGIGKKLRQGRTSTKATVPRQGTTGYMAPETYSSDKVSKSGDIFSLGVTLFELWSNGLNPYGLNISLRDFNVISNKPPDFSGLLIAGPLGKALLDLIKRMLQHDHRLRPTIDEVLNHINAKIKRKEELLSTLNLGARTSSDVESVQKQSETTDQKQLATTSSDQPERTESTQNQAETTEGTEVVTTSSDQPEQTESTLQKQSETTEETESATTSSDQPERTESTLRKQSAARIEEKPSTASNANQQEQSGSAIPKEVAAKTEEKQPTASEANRPERTRSTLPKEIDVRPKGKPGFFRKIFGGTARQNVKASSVQAARTEEKQPTASGVNRPERTGSTFPKEIETVDALMEDSKFNKAVDLLEGLPQTQDQQIKLLKCYVQLGRISEVLKCIKSMRKLVARHPRSKAAEVYKLGLDKFEKSSHIKAIAYFACAAKIYSFESDADEAVRRMCDCSFKSYKAVEAIIKQNKRMRPLAREVGMEIMNSIYCDVTEVSNANPVLKANMEARCLFNTGLCCETL